MLGEEIQAALLLEETHGATRPTISVVKDSVLTVFEKYVAAYPVSGYGERPTATLLMGLHRLLNRRFCIRLAAQFADCERQNASVLG